MSEFTPATTSTTPSASSYAGPAAPQPLRARRAGQKVTVVVLIAALVGAMLTRQAATSFQESHAPAARRTTSSRTSLAGMDSYALALLLGGLRGPLVMVLWAQSESQKADRNLEGIDTQIEWIRRLQPEFDTVHVFQMWNKAYNISVQMVGLANKYTVILDAIDYGRSIDAERPDNLNILKELGRTYGDKLGNSNPEKYYYRERLRKETLHRDDQPADARRNEPGFQRMQHDVLLDAQGNILEQYLRPRRPEVTSPDGDTYNGSDLQYLEQYEPFPYGLSPAAMGYNYNKRAQVLMATLKQTPIQISESVQDSQPALGLKAWAEAESERGRRMELKLFGHKVPTERIPQDLPTSTLALDTPITDEAILSEIIFSYDRTTRLSEDSIKEYERHLRNPDYATKRVLYSSHMDHIRGMRDLHAGDRDYLKAMRTKDPAERNALLASASKHYRASIIINGLTAIRYFTPDRFAAVALPPGVSRANIGTGPLGSRTAVTEEDMLRIMTAVTAEMVRTGGPDMDENFEDRSEYDTYIKRAVDRINEIEKVTKK